MDLPLSQDDYIRKILDLADTTIPHWKSARRTHVCVYHRYVLTKILHENGLPTTRIAEVFGMDYTSIWHYLHEYTPIKNGECKLAKMREAVKALKTNSRNP